MYRVMAIIAAACVTLTCGTAWAKAVALPKSWKPNFEADVPKNLFTGGDQCTKLTAIVRNLDQPYLEAREKNAQPQSRRERMSGGGQYGDPNELKNWVEFRVRQTCGDKRLWAQIWAKNGLSQQYSFANYRRCPVWAMKQNYLTPTKPDAPVSAATFLYLDVYNYSATPHSVEVRMWDAKDFEGQAKGASVCPK